MVSWCCPSREDEVDISAESNKKDWQTQRNWRPRKSVLPMRRVGVLTGLEGR